MYTKNNETIIFADDFNEPISKKLVESFGYFDNIILPSNYSYVANCYFHNQKIKVIIKNKYIINFYCHYNDFWSDEHQTVEFYDNFNEELTEGDISNINYCDELVVHKNYNKSLELVGGNIKTITVKNSHLIRTQDKNTIEITENIPIDNKLYNIISKYKKIIFSNDFNYPINNLYYGLEELEITSLKFSHPLDNLPNSIKKIVLRLSDFNHGLDKLPESVKHLDINFWLKHDCSLDNLPSGLEYLKIDSLKHRPNCKLNNLPTNLIELEVYNGFCWSINGLPANLKKFYISFEAYNVDGEKQENTLPCLNDRLEELKILGNYNNPFGILPSTLKILTIPYNYNLALIDEIKNLYPNIQIIK